MTNREFLVAVLSDENLDPFDNGADGEAMVYYNINCPYLGADKRAHCIRDGFRDGFDKEHEREQCVACKMEWLEMEVDT